MKISNILEVFKVIKFIFDSTVHRLDIAVITPGLWRDMFVFCSKAFNDSFEAVASSILSEATNELRAVVGLELCLLRIGPYMPKLPKEEQKEVRQWRLAKDDTVLPPSCPPKHNQVTSPF